MTEPTGTPSAKRAGGWRIPVLVATIVVLAIVVALGGGVGVLSGLFASGDAGLSRQVVRVLNAALGTESTRFACERVHGTLLRGAVLDRPRLLIRTEHGERPWAEARRATVEYDLLSLLFTKRRVFTVTLDSLSVELARDSAGAFVMPRFRKGARGGTPATVSMRFDLRRASLSLPSEHLRFTGLRGGGDVLVAPGASTVAIRRLDGFAQGPERTIPVRLEGAMTLRDSTWRLDPLEVSLGRSRVAAAADWDPERGRVREGNVRLAPIALDEVLPLFDVEGVTGELSGEVDFSGLPSDGAATGCLEGTLAGETLDTLVVRAEFRGRRIDVRSLQTRVRGATLTGSGTIAPEGALTASLRFTHADPSNLPWWRSPAGMPGGSLDGEATVRLRRARPKPSVHVDGTLGPSRVGRLPIDRATFRVHAAPLGGIVVDTLVLETPGAQIAGEAEVDARGGLRASVAASVRDAGRMRDLAAPVVLREGSGRVTATFGGTLEAPTIDGRATIVRPRTESGLRADTAIVVAAGALAPTLDLRGTARVAALATERRALGSIRASFSGGSPLRIGSFVQTLGDTTLALSGRLRFVPGGVEADVDSLRLAAGAIRARSLAPAGFSYARGRLHASPLTLDLEPGRLDADLDWDVSGGRLEARGVVEGLDLARLATRGARSLEGTLRAQFLVSGPTSDPDVSVSGGVDAPRIGGVAGDSIRARLEYAPGLLTLDSLAWSAGASRASVSGTLRTRRPLEAWLREALRGERPWRAETSLALEAEADSFDLSVLAPIDSTWQDLAGTVHLRARIGGTMEAPTMSLSGRAPRLRVRGLDGTVAGAELEYADHVLRIDRLDVRQGAASTRVTGALPVDLGFFATERWRRDDPIRLSLRMDETDISVLPEFTNLVAASEGKLSGEAEVRGTPRRPKVTGSMRLRDGRIRFAGRYEVLEQVAVDGTFDEERLNLTRIEARQGKQGKIAGSGVWRWTGASALPPGSIGPPGDYRLTLKATDCVATDREYYLFRFSGTFQIVPGATPDGVVKPSITGSAVVSRGDLTMNLSAPANEPRAPLPFLYDINAEFPRDLRYRQLDTEVDLAGSLQLRNEGEGDVALGTLTVTGGQFYFLTRKFQDLTGQVNFNSLERLDPDVAIDASTRIRSAVAEHEDRVIYLAITGRASQLQIRPWVEGGGTSPSDLWRELSVGQFTGGADPSAAGSDPLTGVKLDYLPIGGYLFRNAERWIAGSGFIDTIDLQTGATSGGATGAKSNLIDLGAVGVGKYVTKDLFLKYSRDFSGENDQRISAEYRVTRHLLLRGTQIQRSPSGNQAEQEYNLDLKIRLEY